MERKGEWLVLKLPKHAALDTDRLDQYLREEIGIPADFLARMHKQKEIVRIGDLLRLRFFTAAETGFAPWWHPLEILFEDDFCLVVQKPAGIPVHPSAPDAPPTTLANAVAFHYASTGQQAAVRHIHRLDEWTSGPVLYAKNRFAQHKLDEAMRSKQIERIYAAVVKGMPRTDRGAIDAPIGRDRHISGKRRVSPGGDKAMTQFEVSERYPKADAALLRLRLMTGRTHQIRVHLHHIGHPIIGDRLYGEADSRIGRQALHGEKLIFRHPFTNETVEIEAPMPEDIRDLIRMLAR